MYINLPSSFGAFLPKEKLSSLIRGKVQVSFRGAHTAEQRTAPEP